jgi:putative transposase
VNARQVIWGVEPARRRKRLRPSPAAVARPKRPKRAPRQLSFAEVATRGGPRPGSGRKRVDPTARPNVVHRTRPAHDSDFPVHVTMRRAKGLPSLRSDRVHRVLKKAMRDTDRGRFRITHYSIQADHIHLIVEAEDPTTLTNGMRSLSVRIAMRVNKRVLGRTRGKVWGDRYHRRDLRGPRAVRNALVYVFANHLKHGEYDVGLLDPCSSGPWFTRWTHTLDPPSEPPPVQRPTTWVLRDGWHTKGGGRLHLGELPKALRAYRNEPQLESAPRVVSANEPSSKRTRVVLTPHEPGSGHATRTRVGSRQSNPGRIAQNEPGSGHTNPGRVTPHEPGSDAGSGTNQGSKRASTRSRRARRPRSLDSGSPASERNLGSGRGIYETTAPWAGRPISTSRGWRGLV